MIINAIRSRGVTDKKLITKYAVIASLISGVGLTLVYLSLFKLGLGSHEVAPNASNGAVILHAYVEHAFGPQLSVEAENRQCFLEFLPPSARLVLKSKAYVHDVVEQIFHDGFLQQAIIAGEDKTELEEFQEREKLARDTLLVRPSSFRLLADRFRTIELSGGQAAQQNYHKLEIHLDYDDYNI